MKKNTLISIIFVAIASFAATASTDSESKDTDAAPEFVTLIIGHRVHLDFKDEVTVKLNERRYIGDTEFSFEATAFYPHFAIVDSTKEIISLSDALENPAFKINVYEEEELVDGAWAFYAVQAPHYARTSLISFQVKAFEYRGTVYDHDSVKGAGGDEKSE
jgi:hypothetical protein